MRINDWNSKKGGARRSGRRYFGIEAPSRLVYIDAMMILCSIKNAKNASVVAGGRDARACHRARPRRGI
jgi:hypothetical protein